MRILVTGSSGWLGQTLVPRLTDAGHVVIGLDPVPAATTSLVGSIADRATVRRAVHELGAEAIIHAGALHQPHMASRSRSDFLAVNVQGTLNLLEEAVAPGSRVQRFVFTSTTSLMITAAIRDGRAAGATRAAWITEELQPLQPRNIYGVSKLAAEHLCRMVHETHGLPCVILRTSRFFPEPDDMAHTIEQSDANAKVNELLFRRLTVEDAAEAHLVALDAACDIGFDTFIVSARTPFRETDCDALLRDAPAVVARYFPDYADVYRRLGWSMARSIDRVYVTDKSARVLGFTARTGFAERLAKLRDARGANAPVR